MLNLTRRNVIFDDIDRDTFGNDWFRINAPHDTEELIETNRESLFTFLKSKRQIKLSQYLRFNSVSGSLPYTSTASLMLDVEVSMDK